MAIFDPNEEFLVTPFGRGRSEHLRPEEVKEGEKKSRKIELDRYDILRKELVEMKSQKGGVNFHFSQFNPDNLLDKSLDMYDDYKNGRLTEENLKNFSKTLDAGSPDYQFAALMEHWIMNAKKEKMIDLREKMKIDAGKELEKIMNINPNMQKCLNGINLDSLRKSDYEAIINMDNLNLGTYEERLREYFDNKVGGKQEARTPNIKRSMIEGDQSYLLYRAICNIKNHPPQKIDTFIR